MTISPFPQFVSLLKMYKLHVIMLKKKHNCRIFNQNSNEFEGEEKRESVPSATQRQKAIADRFGVLPTQGLD